MVSQKSIEFHKAVYYTPSYNKTPIKIKILQLIQMSGGVVGAIVKTDFKKGKNKSFPIPLEHLYNTPEDAKRGGKRWESYMKKAKRRFKSDGYEHKPNEKVAKSANG